MRTLLGTDISTVSQTCTPTPPLAADVTSSFPYQQGCAEIARALPSAPRLEALRLRRCGADDTCVDQICRALQVERWGRAGRGECMALQVGRAGRCAGRCGRA